MRYLVLLDLNVGDWEPVDEVMYGMGFYSVIPSEGHYYSLPTGVYYGVSDLLTEQLAAHVEGLLTGLEVRSVVVVIHSRSVARGLRID